MWMLTNRLTSYGQVLSPGATHLSSVWLSCAVLTPLMMNWTPTAGALIAGAGAVVVAHVGFMICTIDALA
jgi:hypothetical protein